MLVSWNTTNQCNLNCEHCYRDAGTRALDELSTAEGLNLIREIARAGFKVMIFSGGEPLMRPDLLQLIDAARSEGLRPVLGTNGTLLTASLARELVSAGLTAAGISLDSVDASRHDHFRRFPGAWDGAVEAMARCREAGLPFQIHTTVMDWNAAEIEDLTDMAVSRGGRGHHIFFLVPTGRAVSIEAESLRTREYEQLLRRIMIKQQQVNIEVKPTCAPQFMRLARQMGIKQRFSKGCLAGEAYCIVTPGGEVQPCAYLPLSAGNVRHTPFSRLWRESPVFQRLRGGQYLGKCGRCSYRTICGGCRARAYYYSGDYMGAEPWCAQGAEDAEPDNRPMGHGCG